MVMPAAAEMEAIRRAFHTDVGFRRLVSRRTRKVLDSMVDELSFPGSTDPSALVLLAAIVAAARPRRVLELGTLLGFSTVMIADLLAGAGHGGRVTTVDPAPDSHPAARRWVRKARLEAHTEFVQGASTDPDVVQRLAADGPFDLVYLDSSHTYEGTLAELAILLEGPTLLAEHGLLVLHDASEHAAVFDSTNRGGVRGALDEWLAARPGRYGALVLEPPFWPNPCGLGLLRRLPEAAPSQAAP
jgi:predicted O-methyltransferase YrrM